ncbi:MAG: F0F1 ATP synthase subunit B [Candidatus Goldbacteria bacterium]|nr:F0F1 ATP synthase subunit B [Candidatus Goldiibacteriota bacterium]
MVKIDLPVFLLQIITFLIAMPVIWILFIKNLSNTLKKRDEYIKNSLDKIEKDKQEMEALKTDYEKKILNIQEESREIITKAVAEGEKVKSRIIEEAKNEAMKLINDAKVEIENEKKKAIEEVKNTIVDISIMAAEKVIKTKINKKNQISIVSEKLKEIEDAKL